MEVLQFLVVGLGLLVFFMGNKVVKILSKQSEKSNSFENIALPVNYRHFAIDMEVEDGWETQFEVGYKDGWLCGPKLSLRGEALFDPEIPAKKLWLEINTTLDAFEKTNVIGWGNITNGTVHVDVSVSLGVMQSLLNELRRNPKVNLYLLGYLNNGGLLIQITRLSLTPNEE